MIDCEGYQVLAGLALVLLGVASFLLMGVYQAWFRDKKNLLQLRGRIRVLGYGHHFEDLEGMTYPPENRPPITRTLDGATDS